MDPLAKGFLFVFPQAGTHHLKRMDKEVVLLCTENMSLGQSILFSLEYFPPCDLTGDVSSCSWKPSLWLIRQVFLHPAPGRTVFWHHSASPPPSFSEDDDVRVSQVLFSKHAHLY